MERLFFKEPSISIKGLYIWEWPFAFWWKLWHVFVSVSKSILCIFRSIIISYAPHLSLSLSRSIRVGAFQEPACSRLHVRRRPFFPWGCRWKTRALSAPARDTICPHSFVCGAHHPINARPPTPDLLHLSIPPSLPPLSLTSCQPSRAHYPGMQFPSSLLSSSDLLFLI